MSHKPGPFTQQNKKHNTGRHRSKRTIDSIIKGRKVGVKNVTKAKHSLMRIERRNQSKQHRMLKKEEAFNKKRQLGGESKPPFLVAVISLGKLEDPHALLDLIRSLSSRAETTPEGHLHIMFPNFKQRFTFVVADVSNTWHLLDTIKTCDTVLFLHVLDDVGEELDKILSLIFAQGLPTTTHAICGLESFPPKRRPEIKKAVVKFIERKFCKEKLFTLETPADALNLVRHLGQQKIKELAYRESRPYLLAEKIDFEPNPDQTSEGTLKATGYIRGGVLDVNHLVYLQALGDFQLSQVEVLQDPYSMSERKAQMGGEVLSVEVPDPSRQTPLHKDAPDQDMSEEMSVEAEEMDPQEMVAPKTKVRKLPPGTSDYQAIWLSDEEESDEESGDDVSMSEYMAREESDDELADAATTINFDEDDGATSVATTDVGKYDVELAPEALKLMMDKLEKEREEQKYPDEVDLDPSESAQKRFAKYKPLKNFKTSSWDPTEDLPADYNRIVDFRYYRNQREKVLAEEKEGCEPGFYVTLHIKNVPTAFYELHKGTSRKPLPVFGLLPHEHQMSLVNLAIQKVPQCQEPVKSKDRLVFVMGFRRFATCPIFSAHTTGNKFKYERFLPGDRMSIASMYAPIMMSPSCPVLVFKDDGGELLAKGCFHSINSRRLIVKRAVLSGYTYSIHKRSLVVRFMFFNREDILAFKMVDLYTRKGSVVKIIEPLGTHGMMKCKFRGKIASNDVIYMSLYKRVFPKWTYEPNIFSSSASIECAME